MSKRGEDGRFGDGNDFGVGAGRPQIPSDLKEARKMNSAELERIINKFLFWPIQDLVDFCKIPENPVIECLVASIICRAINQGDQLRLSFILDRIGVQSPIKHDPEADEANMHAQLVKVMNQIEGSTNGNKKTSEEKSKSNDKEEVI